MCFLNWIASSLRTGAVPVLVTCCIPQHEHIAGLRKCCWWNKSNVSTRAFWSESLVRPLAWSEVVRTWTCWAWGCRICCRKLEKQHSTETLLQPHARSPNCRINFLSSLVILVIWLPRQRSSSPTPRLWSRSWQTTWGLFGTFLSTRHFCFGRPHPISKPLKCSFTSHEIKHI